MLLQKKSSSTMSWGPILWDPGDARRTGQVKFVVFTLLAMVPWLAASSLLSFNHNPNARSGSSDVHPYGILLTPRPFPDPHNNIRIAPTPTSQPPAMPSSCGSSSLRSSKATAPTPAFTDPRSELPHQSHQPPALTPTTHTDPHANTPYQPLALTPSTHINHYTSKPHQPPPPLALPAVQILLGLASPTHTHHHRQCTSPPSSMVLSSMAAKH